MSGIRYEQGDIVIVPFPFSDLTGSKQRPVLVLSKRNYNDSDIITCGITSRIKDAPFSVLITKDDLSSGWIPVKSRIKVDKLFTLEKSIIRKKIGHVNLDIIKKVKKELLDLF